MGGLLVSFLFFLFWILSRSIKLRKEIFGSIHDFFPSLIYGISSWFLVYPAVLLVNIFLNFLLTIFYQGPLPEQQAIKQIKFFIEQGGSFYSYFFLVGLIVPFIEEVIFRGVLQSFFQKLCAARWKGIVVTSLIFSLFHYSPSQGIAHFFLLPLLFFLSLILGFIYEKRKSLWASIGLHGTFNAMTLLFIFKT